MFNRIFFILVVLSSALSSQLILQPAYAAPQISEVFDIDGDKKVKPLNDGLLLLRYLFQFKGDALINRAIGLGAKRKSATQIEAYLNNHIADFDVDGNGEIKALTDGLLALRYFFDFRGASLINNAVASNATRKKAEDIEGFFLGVPKDVYVKTPISKLCTGHGMATYSFNGRVTGTGTVSIQQYTGKDICTGTKKGSPYVDKKLRYTLEDMRYIGDGATIKATMTIYAFGRKRVRTVSIKNGIITYINK